MTIRARSDGAIELKTKTAVIVLDDIFTINEFEAPGPGEYEVSEVFSEVRDHVTHLHAEGIIVAAFNQTQREITAQQLEDLENVDIMLVTFGPATKEELEKIGKLIGSVEPRVVVLAGIQDAGTVEKIEGQVPEKVESLKLTDRDLPDDEQKVYLLMTK